MASGPISACTHTAWATAASSATVVSRSWQPGPILAPSPITVRPSSWVPGQISVSWPIVTSASIQVAAGSTMVTPARIQASSSRSLYARRTCASWTRSFTPWISPGSAARTAPAR